MLLSRGFKCLAYAGQGVGIEQPSVNRKGHNLVQALADSFHCLETAFCGYRFEGPNGGRGFDFVNWEFA